MFQSAQVRALLAFLLFASVSRGASVDEFLTAAEARHGDAGKRAAAFLVAHMPPGDAEALSSAFLFENLDLAFAARTNFPWAASVPEELFLNDVLPYAVFDEPRDPWRAELGSIARELVGNARTASEAAQALNQGLFNRVQVHYSTGRKRPNQSLRESKELGKATCTGLSIILVEACRAVGIPARAVGTPLWTNERGNHTWVEIWDGDWHFAGADEYDAAGLDRGWFTGDAAQARADVPKYAIYATSWKRDGLSFPMVWSKDSTNVAAVNVTARYARTAPAPEESVRLGVRLWDRKGGERIAAKVCVLDGVRRTCALDKTKAGTSDLNDMPRFNLKAGTQGWLRFTVGDEARDFPLGPLPPGDPTVDAVWADLVPASAVLDELQAWLALPVTQRPETAACLTAPLSRSEAARAITLISAERMSLLSRERKEEMEQKRIQIGDKILRWMDKEFGSPPPEGHSLWISMHGGGNAPPELNDKQWQNQIRLYEPAEGIYLAPRAPTDTWNLWHEGHIDPLFQRLIDDHVALRGVDPNRVYLMGYSAGGDGVWQLAPRMADRFAAASMMAGHPNEASLLGLRNLPFAIFMGGNDSAYRRNAVAAERGAELDRLAAEDPGGYLHKVHIYEGLGHWMNKLDAEAVPWMAEFRRNPWPRRIVWFQDDVLERRFYWLQVPAEFPVQERQKIVATVEGQTLRIDGDIFEGIQIRLSDHLLDLDQSVTIRLGGRETYQGKIARNAIAILKSLSERADPASAATAILKVK
ncbi:MAG: transglutaminase domain-containing protein [Verrucomicrobiota bacterium]